MAAIHKKIKCNFKYGIMRFKKVVVDYWWYKKFDWNSCSNLAIQILSLSQSQWPIAIVFILEIEIKVESYGGNASHKSDSAHIIHGIYMVVIVFSVGTIVIL